MKDVIVKVEREKLIRLFKIGVEVAKKRGLCRFCFDIIIKNNNLYLEFFDEDDITIDTVAERAYLSGRIYVDDMSAIVESDVDADIIIGLHWNIERGLEILKSLEGNIVIMSFKALYDDNMLVYSSLYPNELFSAKVESISV